MFSLGLLEALIVIAVLVGIVGALWYVFSRTTTGQLSEEEQYIQRLNAKWVQQREEQRREAERVRHETQQRMPTAQRTPTAPVDDPTAQAGAGAVPATRPAGQADYAAVVSLVQQGKVVEAIRKVRRDTGVGLADAKRLVDDIQHR
ncbi:hypothetical protein GCM10022377_20540 [Zhihengliuella alba]|uniref:Ribosomal protein L7/L12 C-terminal domain-containing protein n=1 Tax=Zhihengliuella alba TaxID=547018 RepID=A0ABP7DMY2_9MICC